MCGQYVLTVDDQFREHYNLATLPRNLIKSHKAYPGAVMPVIISPQGQNVVEAMVWGMGVYQSFNARAETLLERPTFAQSFFNHRCLVPTNGFFENKKFFTLKDANLFSLAGIYQDGQYTVITTEPNSLIKTYHHRMPVVIPPDQESDWLSAPADTASKLLTAFPTSGMELH